MNSKFLEMVIHKLNAEYRMLRLDIQEQFPSLLARQAYIIRVNKQAFLETRKEQRDATANERTD
ncbi:MAG: hypothetical protein CMG93_06025 [Marinomonas sp.]|nr:hypothetical protein [Marinomonas sp.]MAF15520.1 hypothetical protein [Marinomonas sp.]